MGTPAQLGARERALGANLELVTRATATIFVVLYAIGFIILAVHDAQFGIVQFSLLRARILLIGSLFTALVMLSAGALHYRLGYIAALKEVYDNTEPRLQRYRDLLLMAHFVYPASLMALIFNPVVFPFTLNNWWFTPEDDPWWHAAAIYGAFVVMGLGNFVIAKGFSEHPKRAAVFGVGGAFTLISGLYLFGSKNIANLTLFLFLAGLNALQIKRNPDRTRYAMDFRNWSVPLALIAMFIFGIFGNVRPGLGGGAATPVILYLNTPVEWLDSKAASLLLVDETDQGFYVLTAPTGKAFFLPRSNVASMYFGTKDDLPKPVKWPSRSSSSQ
jgi:hypothetical protein